MAEKICCGGFELGEGLELNGRTLSATGGGGDSTETIVLTKASEEFTCDHTVAQVRSLIAGGASLLFKIFLEDYPDVPDWVSRMCGMTENYPYTIILDENRLAYITGTDDEGYDEWFKADVE